jgi:hypothetical protein
MLAFHQHVLESSRRKKTAPKAPTDAQARRDFKKRVKSTKNIKLAPYILHIILSLTPSTFAVLRKYIEQNIEAIINYYDENGLFIKSLKKVETKKEYILTISEILFDLYKEADIAEIERFVNEKIAELNKRGEKTAKVNKSEEELRSLQSKNVSLSMQIDELKRQLEETLQEKANGEKARDRLDARRTVTADTRHAAALQALEKRITDLTTAIQEKEDLLKQIQISKQASLDKLNRSFVADIKVLSDDSKNLIALMGALYMLGYQSEQSIGKIDIQMNDSKFYVKLLEDYKLILEEFPGIVVKDKLTKIQELYDFFIYNWTTEEPYQFVRFKNLREQYIYFVKTGSFSPRYKLDVENGDLKKEKILQLLLRNDFNIDLTVDTILKIKNVMFFLNSYNHKDYNLKLHPEDLLIITKPLTLDSKQSKNRFGILNKFADFLMKRGKVKSGTDILTLSAARKIFDVYKWEMSKATRLSESTETMDSIIKMYSMTRYHPRIQLGRMLFFSESLFGYDTSPEKIAEYYFTKIKPSSEDKKILREFITALTKGRDQLRIAKYKVINDMLHFFKDSKESSIKKQFYACNVLSTNLSLPSSSELFQDICSQLNILQMHLIPLINKIKTELTKEVIDEQSALEKEELDGPVAVNDPAPENDLESAEKVLPIAPKLEVFNLSKLTADKLFIGFVTTETLKNFKKYFPGFTHKSFSRGIADGQIIPIFGYRDPGHLQVVDAAQNEILNEYSLGRKWIYSISPEQFNNIAEISLSTSLPNGTFISATNAVSPQMLTVPKNIKLGEIKGYYQHLAFKSKNTI